MGGFNGGTAELEADRFAHLDLFAAVQSIDSMLGNPMTGLNFTMADLPVPAAYVGWWTDPLTGATGGLDGSGAALPAAVSLGNGASQIMFCDRL